MPLPPDASLDAIKIRIRDSYRNPNVGQIYQAVLKEGPRTFRIATLLEIVDPKTNGVHHFSLKLDSIDRLKSGWFAKPKKSIRLEGDAPNEIEHLYRFLRSLIEGHLVDHTGELRIVKSEDYAKLESLIDALPNLPTSDKLALVKTVLSHIEGSASHAQEFVAAFTSSDPNTLRHIATAARIVQYRAAYDELRVLVESSSPREHALQKHLEAHPWMFGSEYSELLDRRTWTRDDRLDFMLRRTVDGFLEIVEIKTPFPESLL